MWLVSGIHEPPLTSPRISCLMNPFSFDLTPPNGQNITFPKISDGNLWFFQIMFSKGVFVAECQMYILELRCPVTSGSLNVLSVQERFFSIETDV